MLQKTLGRGGLLVPELRLGCMGLSVAYGPVTEDSAAAYLIRQAYDCAVTFFNTAEAYGDNEEFVGEALEPMRSEVVIATKFGFRNVDPSQGLDSRPATAPSGNNETRGLKENLSAVDVRLQPDDLSVISATLQQIDMRGERYPEKHQRHVEE